MLCCTVPQPSHFASPTSRCFLGLPLASLAASFLPPPLQLLFYFLVMRYIFASISFKLRLLAVFRAYSRLWFSTASGTRIDVTNDREARHNSLLAVEDDAAYLGVLGGRGARGDASELLTTGPTTVFVADGRASPAAPEAAAAAPAPAGEVRNPAYTYAIMPPRNGSGAAAAAGSSSSSSSSSVGSAAGRAGVAAASVGSASSTTAASEAEDSSAWHGTALHAGADADAGASDPSNSSEGDAIPLVRAAASPSGHEVTVSLAPVRPGAGAAAVGSGPAAAAQGAPLADAAAGAAPANPANGGRIAAAVGWWQRTQLRVLGNPYEVREGTLTTRQMRALRHFRLAIVIYIGVTAAVSCSSRSIFALLLVIGVLRGKLTHV